MTNSSLPRSDNLTSAIPRDISNMRPRRHQTRTCPKQTLSKPLPCAGDLVEVLWEDRGCYFRGRLQTALQKFPFRFQVAYDDGDNLSERLDDRYWRLLDRHSGILIAEYAPGDLDTQAPTPRKPSVAKSHPVKPHSVEKHASPVAKRPIVPAGAAAQSPAVSLKDVTYTPSLLSQNVRLPPKLCRKLSKPRSLPHVVHPPVEKIRTKKRPRHDVGHAPALGGETDAAQREPERKRPKLGNCLASRPVSRALKGYLAAVVALAKRNVAGRRKAEEALSVCSVVSEDICPPGRK